MLTTGRAQRTGNKSASHGTKSSNTLARHSANLTLNASGTRASKRQRFASIGDSDSSGLIINGTHEAHERLGTNPDDATPPISGRSLRSPDYPISFSGLGTPKFTSNIRLAGIDGSTSISENLIVSGDLTVEGTLITSGGGNLTTTADPQSASGILNLTKGEESTTTGTGSLRVTGGIGATGNIHVGGDIHHTGDIYHTGDIKHKGSTSGTVTIAAAAVTTDHTLTLPDALGTNGQSLGLDPNGSPGDLKWMEHFSSTGVISGGVLSVGTPDTTYTITDGHGHISQSGVLQEPTWSGITNQTITDPAPLQPGDAPTSSLSTRILSYVSIDSNGTPIVSADKPSYTKQREYIFLGVLVHVNGVNLNTVNNEQSVLDNTTNGLRDLCDILGFINVNGNTLGYTGTLNVTKTDGSMFAFGANYSTDANNPHVVTLPAIDTSTTGTFQIRFQDGTSSALTLTSFIIDQLDDGTAYPGTTLTNNYYTVWRAYSFTSNALKFQAPQFEYSTESDAISNINIEAYQKESSLNNGVLIGYIVVREGGDLTTASFLSAPTLGGGGVTGGGSIPSLQTTYNASTSPQLLLTSALGGLQVQDAASPIGAPLLEVNDSGGTAVITATADHITVANTENATSTTTGSLRVSGGFSCNRDSYLNGLNIPNGKILRCQNIGPTNASFDVDIVSGTTSGAITFAKAVTTGTLQIGKSNATHFTDILSTLDSTSTTTGALVVRGGIGITKKMNIGGDVDISGTTTTDTINASSASATSLIVPNITTGVISIGSAVTTGKIRIGDALDGRATSSAIDTGGIVTMLDRNDGSAQAYLEFFRRSATDDVNIMAAKAGGDANLIMRGTVASDFYFGSGVTTGDINIGTGVTTGAINIGTAQTTGDTVIGKIGSNISCLGDIDMSSSSQIFCDLIESKGVANTLDLGTNITTGAINIGTAQTSGTTTIGKVGSNIYCLGDVDVNSASQIFCNLIESKGTSSNLQLGTNVVTGTIELGDASHTGALNIGGGSSTTSIYGDILVKQSLTYEGKTGPGSLNTTPNPDEVTLNTKIGYVTVASVAFGSNVTTKLINSDITTSSYIFTQSHNGNINVGVTAIASGSCELVIKNTSTGTNITPTVYFMVV